jgi:hypothetical protein
MRLLWTPWQFGKRSLSLQPVGLGLLDNMRNTEWGGDGDQVKLLTSIVDGHLSSLASIGNVSDALVDYVIYGVTAPDMRTLLSVLRVNQVLWAQCCCRADDASMFAKRGHVEGDLAWMGEGIPWPFTLRRMLSISSTKIIVLRMRAR